MTNLITVHRQDTFFLTAGNAVYSFKLTASGRPAHLHWGAAISPDDDLGGALNALGRAFSPSPAGEGPDFSLDTLPQELPVYGNTDFRSPALEIFQPLTGSRLLDLRYRRHQIVAGKPPLAGLPCTHASSADDAETLILELEDAHLGLRAELLYTVFPHHPVVVRSLRLTRAGKAPLVIRRALSCSLDFSATHRDFQFVHLEGAWARERMIAATPLRAGTQSIESRRGASSHAHNPFFALTRHGADEERGDAYGFNLVYSGNFLAQVEVDAYASARAQIGINPFDFSWELAPGESFQTPEVVLVYSPEGLGGMSRALHRFYRRHLLKASWLQQARPVLLNNWEATYFEFDANRLERIAAAASGLGVELFVLDDGWFGKRDDDRSSLGDWAPHPRKLSAGLGDLAARIGKHGLAFGIWIEPEMVSPDSDLHRAHPDWCLHLPDRPRSLGRTQLVLDFSRPEVRDEIHRRIGKLLRSAPISYVKWDMNRNMTEIGSAALPPARQQETAHRYILGVYDVLDRITREFPHVLFEGCSGGGGRFDPGVLPYFPQLWTSDNSDAIARLRIQFGTTVAYPLCTMAAHVSAVPNHQVGRVTSLRTRGHVAMTGAFGFELDAEALNPDERAEAGAQSAFYKQHHRLLMEGDLYRLRSPFDSNEAAWMLVSEDRSEALVTHVNILAEANAPRRALVLRGLDPVRRYEIAGGPTWRGDTLMRAGLPVPPAPGDYFSHQWHLKAVSVPSSAVA